MHIGRIIMVTLILGLFSQVCVYAEQPLKLEAKEGFYQFPFFNTQTPVWSYNGQIPGPLIRGRVGTTMVIDFANRLKEPSSIHWHGLRIENAMDGVPGVTQDPVGPGENFLYRQVRSVPGQSNRPGYQDTRTGRWKNFCSGKQVLSKSFCAGLHKSEPLRTCSFA